MEHEQKEPSLPTIDGTDLVRELEYCLDHSFPAPVTEAMLQMASERYTWKRNLTQAWEAWEAAEAWSVVAATFTEAVEEITGDAVVQCDDCSTHVWQDDATWVRSGKTVCEDCRCEYDMCVSCEEYFWSCNTRWDDNGNAYCSPCFDETHIYCGHCEEYYHVDSDHDFEHEEENCDCEAPHLRFTFPANGHGTIAQDERLTVELPAGTIDSVGMGKIADLLRVSFYNINSDGRYYVGPVLEEVGDTWQTKRGNFTRRLSSAFHKAGGFKLPDHVISEVGNLARAHSSTGASWAIEVTRDLNLSAEDFYHGSSCWWQSYAYSRCALKSWGGIGLRTFDTHGNVTGRAWVQPVKVNDGHVCATHDATGADGYIVYNGYGALDGYVASRIIAHLTSKTYRKIGFNVDRQYVNGNTGFLVADEATCAAINSVSFDDDEHDTGDAHTCQKGAA